MTVVSPTLITDFLATAKRPLIVVLGPTASGKTAFSIECALQIKAGSGSTAEVINADSRQLYKGMDIGTAKIAPAEMQGIEHHLLSVLDPKQEVTIAWYQKEAERIIADIHVRDSVPMLVGGSMLYISAIIDGLQPLPVVDPKLRADLEIEYAKDGGKTLHAELMTADPQSGSAIPPENKHHLIRAVEIFRSTGKPKTAQLQSKSCPYDLLILGMEYPREQLIKRIDQRTHELFDSGWTDEVRNLLDRGYTITDPGMKSHGYPEIAHALTNGTDPTLTEPLIAAKTRQYAKRQMTWWRHDERIKWISGIRG